MPQREAAARRPRVTGAARAAPAPHGRPTASELLEAVREFLTGQVMPASSRASWPSTPGSPPTSWASWPASWSSARIPPEAGLADTVAAKLAVANPGYFDVAPPP